MGAHDNEQTPTRVRVAIALYALTAFLLAITRFATFHNRTFDLAFYARMAWGLAEARTWDPITGSHVLGLHVSPILVPLGALGHLIGTVPTLLAAQAIAAALGAGCLARLAQRRIGANFAWLGAAALLLHPNMLHVLTYEFHPGTLALAPLCWAFERLDASDRRGVLLGCLGVLACREDLAMITFGVGVLAVPLDRRLGGGLIVLSLLWLGVFVGVIHPAFAVAGGSFEQHLGRWGGSLDEVLLTWVRHPIDVIEHVLSERRGTYLIRVLAPLAFLPFLRPRIALVALPVIALNLVSTFPTTPNLDSHYLTPALPALAAASIHALARLRAIEGSSRLLILSLAIAMLWAGFPDVESFWPNRRSSHARQIVQAISPDESLQAPDELLPHLAERARIHRLPPPDAGVDVVVLDLSHRTRFAGQGTLLRTQQEPIVRNWLARSDYGVVTRRGPYLMFRRGHSPRSEQYIIGHGEPTEGEPLTSCLRLIGARGDWLHFVATGPCHDDLALRFADGRVELLFEGEMGPRHLLRGDLVRSRHPHGARVRTIRQSGAPAEPDDPMVTITGR